MNERGSESWKVIYNHRVAWFQHRAGGPIEHGHMWVLECPAEHQLFLMDPPTRPGSLWKCPGCQTAYLLPPVGE